MRLPLSTSLRRDGSSLMVVLWAIAVLSFFVFTTGLMVRQEIGFVGGRQNVIESRAVAEAGASIASSAEVERGDPLLSGKHGRGTYEVEIATAEARLPLNHLLLSEGGDVVLRRLFDQWGMAAADIDIVIESMQDFVDSDELAKENGAEVSDYVALGLEGRPTNRPFGTLEEVTGVMGFSALHSANPNWREAFTLFGSGRLDLQNCRFELLAAALGVSLEAAEKFVSKRNGPDGEFLTRDDVLLQDSHTAMAELGLSSSDSSEKWVGVGGETRRIISIGSVGNVEIRIILIVRSINNKILHQREQLSS